MSKIAALKSPLLFMWGMLVGGFLLSRPNRLGVPAAAAMEQTVPQTPVADTTTMQADIAHLKEVVPSQAHSMMDVAYQFSGLWFAGQKNNWPLAVFLLKETRQHIRWTIRIRPIRKDPAGNPVDLKAIYDGIDAGAMTSLQQAIDNKDSATFVATYKEMLVQCYACHKASGKPYLRPMVPTRPPETIINFDPNAKWPE